MIAIAFVHNLLRRHPACTVLLHQPLPTALGHADANGAAAESSGAANGQTAGQASILKQHGQSGEQGAESPEQGREKVHVQYAEGTSEVNGTAQQEASPDDEHISRHLAIHPLLSLC